MMTKMRSVMHHIRFEGNESEEGMVMFCNYTQDEIDNHEKDIPHDVRMAMIHEDEWEEMGKPTTITTTIEPGDLLNNEVEGAMRIGKKGQF